MPWTVHKQGSLSMGFSLKGLSFPSPGDLPNPEMELISHGSPTMAGGFFTTESHGIYTDTHKHTHIHRYTHTYIYTHTDIYT